MTVEAQRKILERRVWDFISGGFRHAYLQSLARWNTPICPLITGLPPKQADILRMRLFEIATEAGAPMTPQPCKANFAVIMAAEPNAVLKGWYKRDYHIFGDAIELRIKLFLDAPQPVRVWYNTHRQVANALPYSTNIAGLGNLNANVIVNNFASGSRIADNEIRAFSSIIVVIDSGRTKDVSLNQLADYVAMIGLAEIAPNSDVGSIPTVLRLFSASDRPVASGLSAWDAAYLSALYHTGQVNTLERWKITQSIVHDIGP